MTPTDALVQSLQKNFTTVIIVGVGSNGQAELIVGPDATLAEVNLLLDRAKSVLMSIGSWDGSTS